MDYPLKKGSKSDTVKDLQTRLNKLGAGLIADRDFGQKTEDALFKYTGKRVVNNQAELNAIGISSSKPVTPSGDKYDWLKKETAPEILVEAVKLIGTKETIGDKDNPVILEWAKELNLKNFIHDSIAWCGLFAAIVVKRAGFEPVKTPLWARAWAQFGTQQQNAMLGDVLVFSREGGGHVGIYTGEDKDCYHVLGGNQGDMVKVARIAKNRCIAIRRCAWKIKQPDNVRVIQLSATGDISSNEK